MVGLEFWASSQQKEERKKENINFGLYIWLISVSFHRSAFFILKLELFTPRPDERFWINKNDNHHNPMNMFHLLEIILFWPVFSISW